MSGLPNPSLNGKNWCNHWSIVSTLWYSICICGWYEEYHPCNTINRSNIVPHLLVWFLALHETKPKDFMHLARWFSNAAPPDYRPYNALTVTAVFMASLPNSVLKLVHTYSITSACIYAFKMSTNLASRSWRVVIIKSILTVALDTKLAYLTVVSNLIMCPPATSLALCLKSSILISDTTWH